MTESMDWDKIKSRGRVDTGGNILADLREEIEKRRTFAIISHPDAGKTTLTEKFLLYGGAINLAGSVKEKRQQDMLFPTGWR